MEGICSPDHTHTMNTGFLHTRAGRQKGASFWLLLGAMLALLLSACGGQAQTKAQSTPITLPPLPTIGGLPPAAAGLQPTGQLDPNQQLSLTIGLATNRQALADDLAAIYDPNSPQFGHYLTPQELTSRYGASQASIDKVTSYLQAQGFQIQSVSPLRNQISVSASVAQIAQTFQIALLTFQQNGSTVFAPNTSVTLPPALKGLVTSIIGLSTFAQAQPDLTLQDATSQTPALNASPSAPNCKGSQASGLSPNQTGAIYGYSAARKAGYTGKGITIAVFEVNDNPSVSEINNFLACMGGGTLHRSVVSVDGGVTKPDADANGEAELDFEYLALLAPDAQLVEFHAQCNDCGSSTGVPFSKALSDSFNQIAADGRFQAISVSWGGTEDYYSQDEVFLIDQSIQYLAAEGITTAISSGDCGAYDTKIYTQLGVDFPASDPYALSVGGTHLQADSAGKRSAEPVWGNNNPDRLKCQNTWGSGGGLSDLFHQPSWQVGPGTKNKYSNGWRQVPDVAAMAWPEPLYWNGKWYKSGGTSAAAPIWAAGIALVDQALIKHHKRLVGATPTFYRLANQRGKYHPYYDVTQGNNQYYPATAGYDLTSGWGAPNLMDFGKALGAF